MARHTRVWSRKFTVRQSTWTLFLCQVKFTISKSKFFRAKFVFWKKEFWREKFTLQKSEFTLQRRVFQKVLQPIFSNLNWTCLLIPLKHIEIQEKLGQVQLRLEKIGCIVNFTKIFTFIAVNYH